MRLSSYDMFSMPAMVKNGLAPAMIRNRKHGNRASLFFMVTVFFVMLDLGEVKPSYFAWSDIYRLMKLHVSKVIKTPEIKLAYAHSVSLLKHLEEGGCQCKRRGKLKSSMKRREA